MNEITLENILLAVLVLILIAFLSWGITKADTKEYKEGYEAALRGEYLNPHIRGTWEAEEWMAGNENGYLDKHNWNV